VFLNVCLLCVYFTWSIQLLPLLSLNPLSPTFPFPTGFNAHPYILYIHRFMFYNITYALSLSFPFPLSLSSVDWFSYKNMFSMWICIWSCLVLCVHKICNDCSKAFCLGISHMYMYSTIVRLTHSISYALLPFFTSIKQLSVHFLLSSCTDVMHFNIITLSFWEERLYYDRVETPVTSLHVHKFETNLAYSRLRETWVRIKGKGE
jgi:hypothetical protein